MNFLRNPWKPSHIQNPILALANHPHVHENPSIQDRYCLASIPNSLVLGDNKQGVEENQNGNSSVVAYKNQKTKQYEGLLKQSCGLKQSRRTKNIKQMDMPYSSKIKRQGYMFDAPEPEQQLTPPTMSRKICTNPFRVLNAPKLKDDFYTNLLDWNSNDIVSVVLDNAAYIWSSKQNETQKLVEGFISSIKWGKDLIVGEETGRMRIIDAEKKKQIARNREHQARIGTLDTYGHNGNLVLSGSKDCSVMIWDVRNKKSVTRFTSHRQQVCGVRFSFDGNMVASGGNDNVVSVWDMRADRNIAKFCEHRAAVKALAWSPHQTSILATGGGSTDKCIRIWNMNEKKCIKTVQTGSQVCNMMYSINSNELVSTHGFSFNSINIWNAKKMQKIGTLTGHTFRVLYLARSPDGESILTGSGDQTLRFWKVFPSSCDFKSYSSSLELKNSHLR